MNSARYNRHHESLTELSDDSPARRTPYKYYVWDAIRYHDEGDERSARLCIDVARAARKAQR